MKGKSYIGDKSDIISVFMVRIMIMWDFASLAGVLLSPLFVRHFQPLTRKINSVLHMEACHHSPRRNTGGCFITKLSHMRKAKEISRMLISCRGEGRWVALVPVTPPPPS